MTDYLDTNQQLWNAWTPLHETSDFYDLPGFRAGKSSLRPIERTELIASVAPAQKPAGKAGPKPTKRIAAGAKIPFHSLRHTALTRLAEVAPRHVVQAIAGHAPSNVTDGYLHATAAEMRQAIGRLEEQLGLHEVA